MIDQLIHDQTNNENFMIIDFLSTTSQGSDRDVTPMEGVCVSGGRGGLSDDVIQGRSCC